MTDDKGKGSTELMTDIRKEDELGPVDFFDMLFFKTFFSRERARARLASLLRTNQKLPAPMVMR